MLPKVTPLPLTVRLWVFDVPWLTVDAKSMAPPVRVSLPAMVTALL